jgi:hypothetical protein
MNRGPRLQLLCSDPGELLANDSAFPGILIISGASPLSKPFSVAESIARVILNDLES